MQIPVVKSSSAAERQYTDIKCHQWQ